MNKLKTIGAMCIVIFVVLIPTAVSYQDLEYLEWHNEKDDMSSFYISKITSALCRDDMSSLKLYSDSSYNFHSDALDEMDNFDISPGYLSIYRDEKKRYMKI